MERRTKGERSNRKERGEVMGEGKREKEEKQENSYGHVFERTERERERACEWIKHCKRRECRRGLPYHSVCVCVCEREEEEDEVEENRPSENKEKQYFCELIPFSRASQCLIAAKGCMQSQHREPRPQIGLDIFGSTTQTHGTRRVTTRAQ